MDNEIYVTERTSKDAVIRLLRDVLTELADEVSGMYDDGGKTYELGTIVGRAQAILDLTKESI